MEFKTVEKSDDKTMQDALDEALSQMENRSYIDEFKNAQISEVIETGIVFCGKKVKLSYRMDAL